MHTLGIIGLVVFTAVMLVFLLRSVREPGSVKFAVLFFVVAVALLMIAIDSRNENRRVIAYFAASCSLTTAALKFARRKLA